MEWGGGENPATSSTAAAAASGIYARSGLDNALYGVNFTNFLIGAGIAYVDHGLTLQAEATITQLIRDPARSQFERDGDRTNFTSGFHAGYAIFDWLTASAEIRFQCWLTTPGFVRTDPSRREQATFGFGLRTKIPAGPVTLRPGVSYFHPMDDPMNTLGYKVLTIDVPILF